MKNFFEWLERNERSVTVCITLCILLGAGALAYVLAGCAPRVKNVTNLPTGVTLAEVQAWDSEVAALQKIATVNSSVRQGIIAMEQAGVFPDTATYVHALQATAKIDLAELTAVSFLRQTPQHFGVSERAKVQAILADIGTQVMALNTQTLAGIKDSATKTALSTFVADLTAAMNLALSFAQ
jgi:hypothetical protein